MLTFRDLEKQRRKDKREFKKIIEQQLHPNYTTRDKIEIAHRHVGQQIIFSAWKNGDPVNENSGFIFDRLFIGCYEGKFYENKTFLREVDHLLKID
mgnify:CR=1 FL=1